jgi:hypothetical protein
MVYIAAEKTNHQLIMGVNIKIYPLTATLLLYCFVMTPWKFAGKTLMPWRLCLYMAAPTRYYSTSAHAHDVQGIQQCMYMTAWTEVYGSSL